MEQLSALVSGFLFTMTIIPDYFQFGGLMAVAISTLLAIGRVTK